MRTFGFIGTFVTSLAALGAGVAACSGGSNSGAASALGESCTKTADCQGGLVCLQNACAMPGHGLEAGSLDGASSGAGGEGGSANGDGGPGRIGELCQSARDCLAGLACVPSPGGAGICDIASFGITPTGKTCSGECGTAADCCELPPGLGLSGFVDGGYVYAQNCQDIFVGLLGGNASICATAAANTTPSNACFFYLTYCNCASNTWTCNAGRCAYAAPCSPGAGVSQVGGCPSLTRSGAPLNVACNSTTNMCGSGVGSCSTDPSCDGQPVIDRGGVTCRGGDCACAAGACYLKCTKDLDCQNGYSCDATKLLCVPSGCTNDAECFSQLGMARAKCNAGACGIPCTVDLDCTPSGDIPGQTFNGTVCGRDGFCAPVGCATDADCSRSGTGPRTFCMTPTATNVRSAITN
jgi:hypothetical protein